MSTSETKGKLSEFFPNAEIVLTDEEIEAGSRFSAFDSASPRTAAADEKYAKFFPVKSKVYTVSRHADSSPKAISAPLDYVKTHGIFGDFKTAAKGCLTAIIHSNTGAEKSTDWADVRADLEGIDNLEDGQYPDLLLYRVRGYCWVIRANGVR